MSNHKHKVYRFVIKLYPKAHQKDYAEQMLQTYEDMLTDNNASQVWSRIILELPRNLAEEHIQNIKGAHVKINKKFTIITSVAAILIIGSTVAFVLNRNAPYEPTTLANVPRSSNPPACINPKDTAPNRPVTADETFIFNTVVSSILDVPAGTNVTVNIKSSDDSTANGTAVYPTKYGAYNFVAKKTADSSSNSYTGGWEVTKLEACKL